jgi:hypothetical protein
MERFNSESHGWKRRNNPSRGTDAARRTKRSRRAWMQGGLPAAAQRGSLKAKGFSVPGRDVGRASKNPYGAAHAEKTVA